MTHNELRDTFANTVLHAMLSNPMPWGFVDSPASDEGMVRRSQVAYAFADVMLKSREASSV